MPVLQKESHLPSSFEQESVLLDVMSEIPDKTVHGCYRYYGVLCVAMATDNGDSLVVRKDNWVHSADPSDWYVKQTIDGKDIEHHVESARILRDEDGYDEIELTLGALVMEQGPFHLRFKVDQDYQSVSDTVDLTHKKYYGRGTGLKPEKFIDEHYTISLLPQEEVELAEVIPIEIGYKRRLDRSLAKVVSTNK